MRSCFFCTTMTAAAVMLLSSCSDGHEEPPTPTQSAPSAGPVTSPAAPIPLAPDEVAVSPSGVTTAVGAPAESTEDDYFQACMAARTWIEQQGGDPKAQIEPFLAIVQAGQAAGQATFGQPWSQLSPGQQSAVIVAVEAAADQLCG